MSEHMILIPVSEYKQLKRKSGIQEIEGLRYQLDQICKLAGYMYYLIGRPENKSMYKQIIEHSSLLGFTEISVRVPIGKVVVNNIILHYVLKGKT